MCTSETCDFYVLNALSDPVWVKCVMYVWYMNDLDCTIYMLDCLLSHVSLSLIKGRGTNWYNQCRNNKKFQICSPSYQVCAFEADLMHNINVGASKYCKISSHDQCIFSGIFAWWHFSFDRAMHFASRLRAREYWGSEYTHRVQKKHSAILS